MTRLLTKYIMIKHTSHLLLLQSQNKPAKMLFVMTQLANATVVFTAAEPSPSSRMLKYTAPTPPASIKTTQPALRADHASPPYITVVYEVQVYFNI